MAKQKNKSVDLIKVNLNRFNNLAAPSQQLDFLTDVIGKLRGCRQKLAKLSVKSKDFKYWVLSVEMWEGTLYGCVDLLNKEKEKPHALAQGAIDTLDKIMKRGEEVSKIMSSEKALGKTVPQIMLDQGVDSNLASLAEQKG